MFEKVVLRRSESGLPITIGEIAEAILFYQNVHLILDFTSLSGIINNIEMPELLSLLARPSISAVYCDEIPATQTDSIGSTEIHQFVTLLFLGNEKSEKLSSRKKRIEYILKAKGYSKRKTKRLVDRFRLLVPIKQLSNDYFIEGGVAKAAWSDVDDPDFITEAMRKTIVQLAGVEYLPNDFKFKLFTDFPRFQIDTNVDLKLINAERKQRNPSFDDITLSNCIHNILQARTDTILASHYGGEFYTSDLVSKIIRLKHKELLKRMGIEKKELNEFNEIILGGTPALRETINSGQRPFNEFLKVLDKSEKFKAWVQGVNPDEKLVKEYIQEITSQGWVSSLPSKTLRYAMSTITSVAAPAAGIFVSAADTLFSEKLLSGWRANHFVEKKLRPFLDRE